MKRREQPFNGFTLVELITVAALIGLLSGITLPSFLRNWEDERLVAATKTTHAWLENLRRKSIQTSNPCRAIWDTSQASISAQCDNEESISSTLNLRAEITNSSNLSVKLGETDPNIWVFTPRGTSTTSAQVVFTLKNSSSDPGRCLRLIAPLGFIKTARQNSEGQCDYTAIY